MLPQLRPSHPRVLAFATALCFGLALAACESESPVTEAPPAGPTKETCEPWDARVCDCPIGEGQQNCSADGTGYGACVCPVKKAVVQPGVTEFKVDASGGIRVEGNNVVFPRNPGEPPPFAANDIIVSWSGEGFLGRVMRVEETPDGWLVETGGKVQLDEAFSELDIDFNDALNVAGAMSKADRDKVFVKEKVGIGFGANGFSIAVSGDLKPTMKIETGSSLKFQPYGTFKLKFEKFAGIPVDIDEFKFGIGLDAQLVLVTTVGLEGKGSITGEIEAFQVAQLIAGIPKPQPLSFPIAAGIAGRIYLNLGCSLTVSGALELKSRFDAGVNAYGGVYWDDGDLLPQSSLSKSFSGELNDLAWDANAVLECYLRPRVGLNILRVFETYVEAGPYADVGVHINKTPYSDFNVGFKGTIGGELGIEDIDLTLAEVSYDLFDYKKNLWRKDFSICGDGYQQLNEECDIGPFYALHSNVTKPNPVACGSDCNCISGFTPLNPVGTYAGGEAWGALSNRCVPACGNGRLDPGEACDPKKDGQSCSWGKPGGGCASDCSHILGVCGDAFLDEQCGERCDEGLPACQGKCGGSCYLPPLMCGDSITDWNCGETCDDGNAADGDSCSATCQASTVCGDGILGDFEQCDDGNNTDCDGCNSWCRIEEDRCGDGQVCGAEECDTGGETYDCSADCKRLSCGDGVVSAGRAETCDDSGETAACTQWCRVSTCGDNYTNTAAGEECDEGGVDTWSCDADCTLPSCGDNHINAARESCDDGDASDCTTGCNYNCTRAAPPAVCGDGYANVWCGEACDDGAANGGCGKCANDCSKNVGLCGDGTLDVSCGEICDDSNTVDGDGCRGDCQGVESCGDGAQDYAAGEICDDGPNATCKGSCTDDCSAFETIACRDGVRHACEVCEDSNTANTGTDDGCTATFPHCNGCKGCSAAVCGDGKLEAGESCEPAGVCNDQPGTRCTLLDISECSAGTGCFFDVGEGLCNETCQRIQTCGDGFLDGYEYCDDGNQGGCTSDCTGTIP